MTPDDPTFIRRRNESVVRALLAELSQHDPNEIGLDDDAEEVLALDSLSRLALVARIEDRFDIRIPDEMLSKLRTLRQLLDAIDTAQLGVAA